MFTDLNKTQTGRCTNTAKSPLTFMYYPVHHSHYRAQKFRFKNQMPLSLLLFQRFLRLAVYFLLLKLFSLLSTLVLPSSADRTTLRFCYPSIRMTRPVSFLKLTDGIYIRPDICRLAFFILRVMLNSRSLLANEDQIVLYQVTVSQNSYQHVQF